MSACLSQSCQALWTHQCRISVIQCMVLHKYSYLKVHVQLGPMVSKPTSEVKVPTRTNTTRKGIVTDAHMNKVASELWSQNAHMRERQLFTERLQNNGTVQSITLQSSRHTSTNTGSNYKKIPDWLKPLAILGLRTTRTRCCFRCSNVKTNSMPGPRLVAHASIMDRQQVPEL